MQILPPEPGQSMQRVRVAMTGLAAVTLLIGVAGVIFSAVDRETPVEAIGAASSDRVANMAAGANTLAIDTAIIEEPLAEIGVAPSKSGGETVNVTVAEQPPAVPAEPR
ncbi:hypothetical protein [Sphingomonas baiyangensis]|uniref:hypothetical protein n=1 Tax=Sphingomonas baiyangensis TaxID=2572576 RepID=UPI001BAEA41C|nr:hypothetical protein [Sphingomonas baiyangensis]